MPAKLEYPSEGSWIFGNLHVTARPLGLFEFISTARVCDKYVNANFIVRPKSRLNLRNCCKIAPWARPIPKLFGRSLYSYSERQLGHLCRGGGSWPYLVHGHDPFSFQRCQPGIIC